MRIEAQHMWTCGEGRCTWGRRLVGGRLLPVDVGQAAYVGRDCGRGRTVGTATVGGMTPWAPVDKQAVGKPGRAGRTAEVAPVSLMTWCDTHALMELAQWTGWVRVSIFFSNTSTTPNLINTKVVPPIIQFFSKLYQVVDNFKRDNFTFRKKFKFST
jgi:hypothetical protein